MNFTHGLLLTRIFVSMYLISIGVGNEMKYKTNCKKKLNCKFYNYVATFRPAQIQLLVQLCFIWNHLAQAGIAPMEKHTI